MVKEVLAPIGIGELFDKISILEIKTERIADPAKLKNVRFELALLNGIAATLECTREPEVARVRAELKQVNEQIWDSENLVRQVAAEQGFGVPFANVAKLSFQNNDRRAALKRRLNELSGSQIFEEKSHARAKQPSA
jgi:hypothetical protein